jgi:hypothetical protein
VKHSNTEYLVEEIPNNDNNNNNNNKNKQSNKQTEILLGEAKPARVGEEIKKKNKYGNKKEIRIALIEYDTLSSGKRTRPRTVHRYIIGIEVCTTTTM